MISCADIYKSFKSHLYYIQEENHLSLNYDDSATNFTMKLVPQSTDLVKPVKNITYKKYMN